MILYHFTREVYLPSIKKYGLVRGDVPISPSGGYNAVWLTTDKNSKKQAWAGGEAKTSIRITLDINEKDPNLYKWTDVIKNEGVEDWWANALNKSGSMGQNFWYIYKGIISPKKFIKIEKIKNTMIEKILLESNYYDVEDVIRKELSNISGLECDGATRIFDYALTKKKIPHKVYQGQVLKRTKKGWKIVIPLHYWIVLSDNRIVDYKARMWIDDNAPNGIFETNKEKNGFVPVELMEYLYKGQEIKLNTSKQVYDILCLSGFN